MADLTGHHFLATHLAPDDGLIEYEMQLRRVVPINQVLPGLAELDGSFVLQREALRALVELGVDALAEIDRLRIRCAD